MICKRCKKEFPDEYNFCPYCGKNTAPKKRRARRPNGSGSVCKISGKRARPWLARIQTKGKRITVGYFQTESEALKAIVMYNPQTSAVHKSMTLKEVFDIVCERKRGKISNASIDIFIDSFEKLKPLWYKDITKLHTEDYQKILDTLASQYRAGTLTHVRSVISEIGKWCVANDLLLHSPSEHLTTPKGVESRESKNSIFTEEQINILWQDNSETAHIVLTLLYTGLRINELFSLKPQDIHLNDNGYNYLIGGEKTTAGKNRTVFIHQRIVPFFQSWLANNNTYLIVNKAGHKQEPRTWRTAHYYPLLKRLGIPPLSPHKTRHTFATRIAAAGGNINALQKTIGHASYTTTANIYTHPDMEALKKLIELQK